MFKNPFADFNFNEPFGARRSRSLFGAHTTPREWKHGARDIPFGKGAMSLYVDGTDGHDSNDGESWKTAKATIQGAVDTADPWAQIFIKAGTYAENVSVYTRGITLFGESIDNVIVQPSSGRAIYLTAADCKLHSLTARGAGSGVNGAGIYGYFNTSNLELHNIKVGTTYATGTGVYLHSDYANIEALELDQSYPPYYGIIFSADYCTFTKSTLKNPQSMSVYFLGSSQLNKIYENTIDMYYYLSSLAGANNATFHNNFLSSTTVKDDSGETNQFFENFYADHTNIDNGYGIATEPYSFTTGSDSRPVIVYGGWDLVDLHRNLLRKKTAAQTTAAATDANGTAWVDLKTIAPTTSDIELYRLKLTTAGSWAGTAKYRIIIGATKVYPFGDDKDIDSGILEDLIFPINIQINETCKIQFRSDNAGDGAGETVTLNQLDYATVL